MKEKKRVDIGALMAEKAKEIEKTRELYPHETITPLDVVPDGYCVACGVELDKDDLGFCKDCEKKYYG